MSFDRERFVQSQAGTVIVALVLCLVCSAVVSVSAIGLRPRIQQNKELKVQRNVLAAAGLWDDGMTPAQVDDTFKSIETVLVNLPRRPGEAAEAGDIATGLPAKYDSRKAAKDPKLSVEIPVDLDIAKIKRREVAAPVYLVKGEGGKVKQYIFPVYGKGLWSTLYGFIALQSDLRTVNGITFYEHGETPGLGGEIDNPNWKSLWKGKEALTADGQPEIDVIKGKVESGTTGAAHKIDGLSGATLTSTGVEGLVNYWLGPDAFGPYIARQQNH
ncbi:MAG: Na(+)-translocating NADH-quinone reductase subunit C [Planctomycetaceae bacterium]